MNNKKINILDCTFRDGGYYNDWNFDRNLVQNYLYIMEKTKINLVELGFRFLNASNLGENAFTTDEYLDSLNIPKNVKVAVMINAKEYLTSAIGVKKSVNKIFLQKKYSKVEYVRVAVHIKDAKLCKNLLTELKDLGYKVILNLMQASSVADKKFISIVKKINTWKLLDVLYFADSFGDMNPKKIVSITKIIRENYENAVGFHAHNNKGYALINSLSAIENGVKYIDCTIMGMGRGAGNVQTENLILELNSSSYNRTQRPLVNLYPLLFRSFKKLYKKYKWGTNIYYFLAAEHNIHPTYIQTMLEDKRYLPESILNVINFLKDKNAAAYNDDNLEKAEVSIKGSINGTWSAKNFSKNKDILIIASGDSLNKYKKKLQNFIKKNDITVISLNINQFIDSKFIDFYLACDYTRIMVEMIDYINLGKPVILPLTRVNKQLKKEVKKINFLDYGLKLGKNNFRKIQLFGCELNKPLAISYALSIANVSRSKQIYIAGADGYTNNNPNQKIIKNIISEYQSENLKKIVTLTPSKYDLEESLI